MGQTTRGIKYPSDYSEVADVPEDLKKMAESIDELFIEHDTSIENLENQCEDFALVTETGNKLVLEIDNNTYKIKAVLKDKNNNVIDTSNEIDLPLEEMVTNVSYNNQSLVLTYKSGQTSNVSIADLINGLVNEEDFNALEEIVETNSKDIVDIAKENRELQSQISDLETLVETELESNEVEGTEIDVSDSAEYPGKIIPGGNLEQEQLSGNQLVDFSNYTKISTNGEYTFVNNILIFGNKSGTFSHVEFDVTELAKSNSDKVLKFTFEDINLNNQYGTSVQLIIKYNDGTNTLYKALVNHDKTVFSYTIPSYTNNIESITLCIYSNNSNTSQASSVIITKPMLQFGTEDKDYEPYCGGQASPNPSYPQNIEVVTGDNVVNHVGQNFCGLKDQTITNAGVTFIIKDGVITANGTYTANTLTQFENEDNLVLNGNYTVKTFPVSGSASTAPNFNVKNSDGTTLANSVATSGSSVTFLVEKSSLICGIYAQRGTTFDNFKLKAQIEKGTNPTPYEPYREEEYELSLGNMELCKIGDYSDILLKNEVGDENYNAELEDGAWYKKKVINKRILDGSENWMILEGVFLLTTINDYKDRENTPICDCYKGIANVQGTANMTTNNTIAFNLSHSGMPRFFVKDERFSTSADFKNWLSTHNIIIYYILNEPTYEKITDQTLISQLEALKKAKWFKVVNHWFTETENLKPVLKGTYKQSNNLRLQALEQAVVALGGV